MLNFKEKYRFFHKILGQSVIKSFYYAWRFNVEVEK